MSLSIQNITYQCRCKCCERPLLLRPNKNDSESYIGLQLIGEGGFSKVIEVKDNKGNHQALKLIHFRSFGEYITINTVFEREVKVLSQLNHPGIPKMKQNGYFIWPDKSRKPSMYCLVMEKIDGSNLAKWLDDQRNWPVPENQVVNWLEQLVEIIDVIHKQNYIHRDIKPSNIIRRPNGQLVLIDFGAARELTETYYRKQKFQSIITGNTIVFSSYGYTPEEQLVGKPVPQSDFFSLGRTFVHILTGIWPAEIAFDLGGKLAWHSHAPNISKSFADLIDKLIEKEVEKRPQNTQEIRSYIKRIKEDIRQQKIPVIFQKPKPLVFCSTNKQWNKTSYQVLTDKEKAEIASEIFDVFKEASIREILDALINKKRLTFEGFKKRVKEVGFQKIITRFMKKLQNINSGFYIILLLVILSLWSSIKSQFPPPPKLFDNREKFSEIVSPYEAILPDIISLIDSLRTLAESIAERENSASEDIKKKYSIITSFGIIPSESGKLIAINGIENNIYIYRRSDTGKLELIQTIKSYEAIEFIQDDEVLVTINLKGKFEFWDIKTERLQHTYPLNLRRG